VTFSLPQIGASWIRPEQTSNSLRPLFSFLALTCVMVVACLTLGPYPITKFPQDTLYFLTQGDMLLKGYRPYVDFYSMHGPFPFLFSAAGMYFHGVSLESIILAQVLGGVVFGALMFKIASNRVNGFWAVLLAISIELILVTCTPVGSKSWREFTCAMWYNTIGYCILATIALYLFVPSRSTSRLSNAIDQFIIAFVLMACFMTKVSYFVPVVAVFVFGQVIMPRSGQSRGQGILILALAGVLSVALMASLGGSIASYLRFLSEMSVKVSPVMLALRFLHYTMTLGQFLLGIVLLLWFAYDTGLLRRLKREWVLIVLMLGTWLGSAATSAQDLEILPMLGIVPLAMTVLLVSVVRKESLPVNKYLVSTALAIAFLLIVHVPKNSILSWGFSHIKNVPTLAGPVERLSPGELTTREFEMAPQVNANLLAWLPRDFVDQQIDALSLIKRFGVNKGDTLFVAADQSSLNTLSGIDYPHRYVAWWPFIYLQEPETIALIDDQMLADADWILRDSYYEGFWRYLKHHRGGFIDQNFDEVGTEGQWTLYRRKAI
jgi:hypothetical protein